MQKRDITSHRQHRLTHVATAALRHKYAILEHELRLQVSKNVLINNQLTRKQINLVHTDMNIERRITPQH